MNSYKLQLHQTPGLCLMQLEGKCSVNKQKAENIYCTMVSLIQSTKKHDMMEFTNIMDYYVILSIRCRLL